MKSRIITNMNDQELKSYTIAIESDTEDNLLNIIEKMKKAELGTATMCIWEENGYYGDYLTIEKNHTDTKKEWVKDCRKEFKKIKNESKNDWTDLDLMDDKQLAML